MGTLRSAIIFITFRDSYDGVGTVGDWLQKRKIVLIIDELNIIPCTTLRYTDMSALVDNIVQRDGCAVLYSTHQRDTAALLRGRRPGTHGNIDLSKRPHLWVPIPRLANEGCLHGLKKESAIEASFWSGFLRGRVPALVLRDTQVIEEYTDCIYFNEDDVEERVRCLKAMITGDIESLTNARNTFRAYSYMCERFNCGTNKPKFAWPPFMAAQYNVLGKDYRQLYETLQNPCIEEARYSKFVHSLQFLFA